MNFYEKPSFTVEALYPDNDIAANDAATLGEVDPLGDGELSIPAGDWGDLVNKTEG
ncbi:MAG: hypothetical protein IJA41_06880 [Clostridia bacterium]|nr:hypothetical protein [Clostridia bacterium]